MKSAHLLIPDLLLPPPIAAEACAGLRLSALEKLLARAQAEPLATDTLEDWLCAAFGVSGQGIAPVTLQADGIAPGTAYWLRADPVHLYLQRDQVILQPGLLLTEEEAAQLCASLNAHFATLDLRFFAPHPQRWYVQLDTAPDMTTSLLSQVAGKNAHACLPQGEDALRWNRLLNEIQMLLFSAALNQAREARGELPVNSVWLWGGGYAPQAMSRPYSSVCGDSELADAFARAAGISSKPLPEDARDSLIDGDVLLVWEGLHHALQQGDLQAWRDSLQCFEQCCAAPLLDALNSGRIARITLDALQSGASRRFVLTRGATWKLWRLPKPLARYAV